MMWVPFLMLLIAMLLIVGGLRTPAMVIIAMSLVVSLIIFLGHVTVELNVQL